MFCPGSSMSKSVLLVRTGHARDMRSKRISWWFATTTWVVLVLLQVELGYAVDWADY